MARLWGSGGTSLLTLSEQLRRVISYDLIPRHDFAPDYTTFLKDIAGVKPSLEGPLESTKGMCQLEKEVE